MKLSTRCRYGIHAMVDLAQHYGQGPQTLHEIAERQQVPEMFLEQIIGALRREGFVESVRGAQGGYWLKVPPQAVSIGALMRLLDGPILMADCMAEGNTCSRSAQCPSRAVWERLTRYFNDMADSITLKDMLTDCAGQEPAKE